MTQIDAIKYDDSKKDKSEEQSDPSLNKEVKDSLGQRELSDDVYKGIEYKIPGFFDNEKNREIFRNISSDTLLSLKRDYGNKMGEKIYNKYALDIFIKILKNKDYNVIFFDKRSDVIIGSIIGNLKEDKNIYKNQKVEENIERMDKKIDNLNGLYKNIDSKFKGTSEEIKEEKLKSGNRGIIKTLNNVLNWTEDKITKYFRFFFVAKKLTENVERAPTEQEKKFVSTFNELNKDLGISEELKLEFAYYKKDKEKGEKKMIFLGKTSLNDITDKQILRSPEIKEFIDSKDQTPTLEAETMFDLKDDAKSIIKLYAKKSKKLAAILKYINDDGSINKEKIDDLIKDKSQKEILIKDLNQQIKRELDKIKKDIEERTNKQIKERVMTNCFKSLSMYFHNDNDSDTENFSDMKINANKDIKFDKNTQEIYIKGNMNGKHIGLHYNLKNGAVKMDDFMAYKENEGYVMGQGNEITRKLFTLPTYGELISDASSINIQEIASRSEDINDYDNILSSQLDGKISKNFGDKVIRSDIVEKENQKNMLEQEIIGDIFTNRNKSNKDVDAIDVNKQTPIKIDITDPRYKLLRLIDTTLRDTNEPNELLKFRNSLKKFDTFVNKRKVRKGNHPDPLINALFNKDSMESSMENRKQKDKENEIRDNKQLNYYTFFSRMTKPSKTGDPKIDIAKFNYLPKKLYDEEPLEEAIDIPSNDEYHILVEEMEDLDLNGT